MDAGQPAEAVDDVLDGARRAAGLAERPALVLLVMTRLVVRSRVPEPVVQATTLLHLGSAQRLIQLAADEIGLATWPLGFDADALVDRVRDLDNPYGTRAVKLVIGRSASPQEEEPAAPSTPGS
jgi:isopentenyl diphosphate isomerase/L-lactate dehydrogenase-like FMN-dependent dehydrogenase